MTELYGIVSNAEVRRLCGLIRIALAGRIDDVDRQALIRYTQLQRRFTTAEARRIEILHSYCQTMSRRKKMCDDKYKPIDEEMLYGVPVDEQPDPDPDHSPRSQSD